MRSPRTISIIVAVIAVIVLAAIVAYVRTPEKPAEDVQEPVVVEEETPRERTIGSSVEGRVIRAYTYGSGETELLFVGGMHGGYEWNSVLLAYRFMDYLDANPGALPPGISVTVVPSLNPDGIFAVVGKEGRFELADIPAGADTSSGRFNANGVDLNRNFDCKWQPSSTWRGAVVSAGTSAFSEPEAIALRDLVNASRPDAVIFWHSQGNAVYASECEQGILPETLTLMRAYASASGYAPIASFDAYEITGDAEGWLASIGIPALTVELSTHETVEWERNLAGIEALLRYFSSS